MADEAAITSRVIAVGEDYTIRQVEDGSGAGERSITCAVCSMTSWQPEDVDHLYCHGCREWHELRAMARRYSGPPRTTRCFVCGNEQWVGVVERGQDCLTLTPEGLRCCGRYIGLCEPRPNCPPAPPEARDA